MKTNGYRDRAMRARDPRYGVIFDRLRYGYGRRDMVASAAVPEIAAPAELPLPPAPAEKPKKPAGKIQEEG